MNADSFAFIQREVMLTARGAKRAIEHLDSVGNLPIPELKQLAHDSAAIAAARYRSSVNKREWEIRQFVTRL